MNHRPKMANFLAGGIYGITAEEFSLGRSNIEVVKLMLDAGIKVIQYREKNKPARQMYQECLAIRELTGKAGATFIVNDFVDLGMAVGADGVHIGQDDLPPDRVRELVGPDMVIGLSTHSPEQALAAERIAGVIDHIGVGPIFATSTKKEACAPVGLEFLEFVAKNISLPFVAIGGIKYHNLAEVCRRGAKTVVLVSEIVGAADITATVHSLSAIMAKSALTPTS